MTDCNQEMQNYIETLVEKGTGYSDMMTLIVSKLGGVDDFNSKCRALAREGADSSDVLLSEEATLAIYDANKKLILGHAEHLSLLLNYNSITDLMIHSDWSGWVADFGSTRLNRALLEKENKGHASAVNYLVKYLVQQLCVDYVAYLESINGAVTADVKSYLDNIDAAESAVAKILVAHYGSELNFHQNYPTIAEKGVGIRWTEFNQSNAVDLYDDNKEVILSFASEVAQEYGHDSIAELLTYTEYNRRGWIGMSADTINNRLYDPAAENRTGVVHQFINFIADEVSGRCKAYLGQEELSKTA